MTAATIHTKGCYPAQSREILEAERLRLSLDCERYWDSQRARFLMAGTLRCEVALGCVAFLALLCFRFT